MPITSETSTIVAPYATGKPISVIPRLYSTTTRMATTSRYSQRPQIATFQAGHQLAAPQTASFHRASWQTRAFRAMGQYRHRLHCSTGTSRPPVHSCLVTTRTARRNAPLRRFPIALVAAIAVLATIGPAAYADDALYFRDDPLYRQVALLSTIAGSTPPPSISPISVHELRSVLANTDPASLPRSHHPAYREVLRELCREEKPLTGSIGLGTSLESYLHTSDVASYWEYTYPDRRPFLSVPIRLQFRDTLSIEYDLDWRKNYPFFPDPKVATVNPDPLVNVPLNVSETDVQFPFHAVVALGGPHWSLQMGRSRISMGHAASHSLVLSDHVDFHDFLVASVWGKLASYRAVYVDLEPWVTLSTTVDDRMFFLHRIELRPTSWLSLAANDGFIFSGKPIELRYLNPLMITHSWFVPAYGNSILLFETAVRPIPRVEIFAHFLIDQLQSQDERDRGYGETEPEAFGYMAGMRYTIPVGRAALSVGTEWVYLDPWTYLGRSLLGSFTYRRRVQAENVPPGGGKIIVEKSLGYPDGPDQYRVALFATADAPRLTADAELSLSAKGHNTVGRYLPIESVEDSLRVTPSGDVVEYSLRTKLSVDATLAQFAFRHAAARVTAGATMDFLHSWNYGREPGAGLADFQFAPYVGASITQALE